MTTDTRIPPTEITGLYGAAVKLAARKMIGEVPDSIGVLWHHPAVMKDAMSIGRKVEGWKELDRHLATYAVMASAAYVGCSACLDLNYFMAHNHKLDEAKAREVPRWREASVFSPLERRVMEYAEAMSQTPPAVTDEMSARLLDQLGAPALVELTAFIGLANLYTRTNTAFGIESQEFSAACDLKPLAVASTT